MKKRIVPIIRNIGYFIGLALLIYQAYNGVIAIKQGKAIIPGIGAILMALLISILALAFQIAAWWFIMKGLRSKPIPLKEVFWGYTLSFLPRYIPGTIWGYMSRGNWLKTDYDIDYTNSSLGSIIELALMVIVNLILSSIIFLHYLNAELVLLVALFILLIFIFFVLLPKVRSVVIAIIKKLDFRYISAAILSMFCTWILYGFSLFISTEPYNAFHLVEYERFFLFVGIYSAAWLIGFLVVFVPAGMGIREVALSRLLVATLTLDPQTSSGLSVFFRLVISISELSWLIIGWLVKKLFCSKYITSSNT